MDNKKSKSRSIGWSDCKKTDCIDQTNQINLLQLGQSNTMWNDQKD